MWPYGTICALLLMSTLSAIAAEPADSLLSAAKEATSDDLQARREAVIQLTRLHLELELEWVNRLDSLPPDAQSRRYHSPLHSTLMSLGTWRMERAVPKLLSMVSFEMDAKTFPAGGFRLSKIPCYPAAEALCSIGGPKVADGVLELLARPADDTTIRVLVFTLRKVVGNQTAETVIQHHAAQQPENQNWRKAVEIVMLKTDGQILPWKE